MLLYWLRKRLWQRKRLIFRYHDGTRNVGADPIEVSIAMHAHPKFLYRHLHEAVDGNLESQTIVSDMACEIFNVKPLSPDGKTGLTRAELLALVMAFDLYRIALKKNIEPLPI